MWGAKGEAMWTMGTLVRGLNLLAKVEEGKEGEGRCQQEVKPASATIHTSNAHEAAQRRRLLNRQRTQVSAWS